MLRVLLLIFASLASLHSYAQPAASASVDRVIYITIDGVRWQDVFENHAYLNHFWHHYAKLGTFYGAPNSHSLMEVASIPVSLPSYQSQLAGVVQPCDGNDCGRIKTRTFAESFIDKGMAKKDVAVFSNWHKIKYAAESRPNTIYTNIGNEFAYNPLTGKPDDEMARINKLQIHDHPKDNDRFDKYTFAQAMHYWRKFQPRFMWMSFGDADVAAHAGNLALYRRSIAQYDKFFDELFQTLKQMKCDHRTLVIITTDHGRGNGHHWTDHGTRFPEAKRTWAFVMNGSLIPMKRDPQVSRYSTLSIRPTIEAVLR